MICCLDLEGVLVPEIWMNVAQKTGIKELMRTTRDEPNYDKLMRYRLGILKKRGLKLRDIQNAIKTMKPFPGAKSFLKRLQSKYQVIILSDTYYEFAGPLMKQFGYPVLFCNWLSVDSKGFISRYHLRQKNGKAKAVQAFKKAGLRIVAVGDSYNDIAMLKTAHQGILFKPPASIAKKFRRFRVVQTYKTLFKALS